MGYVGAPGTPSGAFIAKTAKVRTGANTVADEIKAHAEALQWVIPARQFSEEVAGLRADVYNTAGVVAGSATPTSILVGAQAVRAAEGGRGDRNITGYPARAVNTER